jgi:hypothetical protein
MLTAQEEGQIEYLVNTYLDTFLKFVYPPREATEEQLEIAWNQMYNYSMQKSERLIYMRKLLNC